MQPQVSGSELNSLRRVIARIAGEVAGFLRDHFGESEYLEIQVRHGEDEGMRIDVESEKLIIELLGSEGIKGVFIGEEYGELRLGSDPYIVVVDPLDGSRNYASMIPWAAVSIGLAYKAANSKAKLSDIIVGALAPLIPSYGIYSFAKGLGVYEDETRLEKRQTPLARLIFAYMETPSHADKIYNLLRELGGQRAVRALGSASLEALWAALGRVEAFIDIRGKLRVVDIAVATAIARELGSYVFIEYPNVELGSMTKVGYVIVTAFNYVEDALRKTLAG